MLGFSLNAIKMVYRCESFTFDKNYHTIWKIFINNRNIIYLERLYLYMGVWYQFMWLIFDCFWKKVIYFEYYVYIYSPLFNWSLADNQRFESYVLFLLYIKKMIVNVLVRSLNGSKKLYYKMYMIEMSISFIGSCDKHSPLFKQGNRQIFF